jgi:hypothetical protein
MAITATPMTFNDTGVMQRVLDEAQYVLGVLNRMRDQASENPELYDPDASRRIDEAIARVEDGLKHAQVMVHRADQNLKAA